MTRTRKPRISEQTMRDCICGHYRAYENLSYEESTTKAQSFVGEALEAEYTRVMEWSHKGYTHVIDPALYDRLDAINHCIKLLQDDRDKIIDDYQKSKGLTHEHFRTAMATELSRRLHLEVKA